MTAVVASQTISLTDAAGAVLGSARVESVSAGLILGDFTPGPGFRAVEAVFRHFADVVDQQAFTYADEAEAAVARLGIAIRPSGRGEPIPVHDVQIYPDGGFSCRLPAGRNGTSG